MCRNILGEFNEKIHLYRIFHHIIIIAVAYISKYCYFIAVNVTPPITPKTHFCINSVTDYKN